MWRSIGWPDSGGALIIGMFAMAGLLLTITGCSESADLERSSFTKSTAVLTSELRIDGHAEETVEISDVVIGEDGVIAMLQPQKYVVRFFSAAGEALGEFGGRGDGPGEFRWLRTVGWRADTLWIHDPSSRRLTLISPDLSLARMVSDLGGTIYAVDENGWLVRQRGVVEWVQSMYRSSPEDPREQLLLELPTLPADAASVRTEFGQVVVPFANLPLAAHAPDGSRVVGAMAFVDGPDAGTFLLTSVAADGDTIFTGMYRFESEVVTREVADSVIDARVGGIGSRYPEWEAAVRGATRVPPIWPPLLGLLVGGDGTVWVRHREKNGEQPHYVIGADGSPVGTLYLPTGHRLAAAEMAKVWVVEPDDLGVESLVRYAVTWK